MTDTFGNTQVPVQYQNQIVMSAARWNVSPAILAAQLNAESGFNANAVSSAGAVGIAQFLPSTASSIGVDPWNALQAIDGMARLDASYLKQFGSIDKALAAYNAGPGAVSKYDGIPPFAETQNYVKKILGAAGSDLAAGIGGTVDHTVALTDPLSNLTKLASAVSSADFWKRSGVAALGVVLVGGGVYFMLSKEAGSLKVAKQIAGNLP